MITVIVYSPCAAGKTTLIKKKFPAAILMDKKDLLRLKFNDGAVSGKKVVIEGDLMTKQELHAAINYAKDLEVKILIIETQKLY